MLDFVVGYVIGYGTSAGLQRIENTMFRRASYFVVGFVMWLLLVLIGQALVQSAGYRPGSGMGTMIANGMTAGLIVTAFSSKRETTTPPDIANPPPHAKGNDQVR